MSSVGVVSTPSSSLPALLDPNIFSSFSDHSARAFIAASNLRNIEMGWDGTGRDGVK
jgi:hypothetical protein